MSLKKSPTKTKSPKPATKTEFKTRAPSETKRYRSFLFYGPSGTGKTTVSGTFPTPILFGDVRDRGTDSIAEVEDVHVYDVESSEALEEFYWEVKDNPKKYKTVVLDTVTQLAGIFVEEIVAKKRKNTRAAGDWGSMTMREWGDVAAEMKKWIDLFKELPVQTVFLAQHRVFNVGEEDNADNQLAPEVGPRLSPSVASAINAAVDVIGSTFIRKRLIVKEINGKKVKKEKTEYCMRVGPNPVYTTKIRKPKDVAVPEVIVNPSYEEIMAIIKGEQ